MSSENENNKLLPPLMPMTAKAAKYHSIVFMRDIAARIQDLRKEVLSIFVCGPNESSNPLTSKRLETINSLRQQGHAAFTGEEMVPELKKIDKNNGNPEMPSNYYEKILAEQADLVIIFCASPGSIGETHEFLSAPVIARKTLICSDEAHKDGYTANGVLAEYNKMYGQVITYKAPDDLVQCKLKTAVLSRAADFQMAKAIRKVGF